MAILITILRKRKAKSRRKYNPPKFELDGDNSPINSIVKQNSYLTDDIADE